ncbi:MAG: hypothetical protein ACOC44_17135 [Promethearchaeia archaeon]
MDGLDHDIQPCRGKGMISRQRYVTGTRNFGGLTTVADISFKIYERNRYINSI